MPAMTVDTSKLSKVLKMIHNAAEDAIHNESGEDFAHIEKQISELDAYARELQQSMWASEAKSAIRSLEKGVELTQQDSDVIHTFLVCDAEHYLAQENNYGNWLTECRRLMSDIATRINTLDQHTIGHLRGTIKDLVRLVPDIRNYLDEQHRVERFNKAMGNMDQPSRDMIARLMKEQLRSPNR